MIAASHGHLEVVKVLVEHGASAHAEDANGVAVYSHAMNNDHKDIVAFFDEFFDKRVGSGLQEEERNGVV